MERTDRVDQIMETSSDLPGETASVIRERADAGFVDREAERGQIARLLEAAGQGLSAVLVLRGEPGIGKTTLLSYAVESARNFSVLRVAGIESEAELGFAALHQLLLPFLGSLDALPEPQRQALATALGRGPAGPPDRFLVGPAALTVRYRGPPRRGRCCASWTTRSGSTRNRPACSPSSPGGSAWMPSPCCSPCATQPDVTSPSKGFPRFASAGFPAPRPGNCSHHRPQARSMTA